MKPITINRAPKMRLEQFAEKHGLTIEVNERLDPSSIDARFFASIRRLDVKGSGILISTFGNGRTPHKAIRAYARELSNKTLVVDAFGDRKEIQPITLT